MSTDDPASTSNTLHPGRRRALVAFKLAVSLILLSILFSRIDVSKLWASAQTASIPWLVAALAIYSATVAASVWRWHLLLDAQDIHVETNRLAGCFGGAVFVQASTVAFYLAVAHGLRIAIGPWDLAVIVPLSFIIQSAPVSINGFGVREAAFTLYFSRLRLPIESALLVSLVPTALVMLFSLSGAAVYVGRRR